MTTPLASAPAARPPLVPELGPALGRLTLIPGARASTPPAPQDAFAAARLALVGRLFDLASAARSGRDAAAAATTLSPGRLRLEWERAATGVADQVLAEIGAALNAAGARSSFPARRLRRAALTAEEQALIRARLLGAGVPFADELAALDVGEAGSAEWREALLAAMRRLEVCWLALEGRAQEEVGAWRGEIDRIAAWRPSPWPRRITATLILSALLYAGLVLGGFLPVPPGAQGVAEWWWAHDQ